MTRSAGGKKGSSRGMWALKSLVIGMGVLIVLGLGLVAYGLVGRGAMSDRARAGFADISLDLAAGCGIAETHTSGDYLVLRIEDLAAGYRCQSVIVIDIASGKILGRVLGSQGQ